ncbi:carbamoyltransferase HypF [Persephonella sp.]
MKRHFKIRISGAVQGVGFRPFVYNLAVKYDLKGYVTNDNQGVLIEIEGEENSLNKFLVSLNTEKPPLSHIFSMEIDELKLRGFTEFKILKSKNSGKKDVFILPDIFTCEQCINEMLDQNNRRYRYPFINCTNCGPRFSIIEKLPYDRKNTTMRKFKMCKLCEAEYKDPNNRRFHAQPNACPVCGPYVQLYSSNGTLISEKEQGLKDCIDIISEGKIIAVKGIGGFHLTCLSVLDEPVKLLRERKHRKEKPFAVMFNSIEQIECYTEISEFEKSVILSPERPIVIVKKRENTDLSNYVSPDLNRIGVFLPYTPLHFLLLNSIKKPLIMTSGNMSDEPIVKDNDKAFEKLSKFTDYILVHNRDIRNRVDDSVVRVINKRVSFVRRSRGYAPLPIKLPFYLKNKVLSVGCHLKNTVGIGFDDKGFLSQHIGDLETLEATENFEDTIKSLLDIYSFDPEVVISDMHPNYYSTKWAEKYSKEKGIKHVKIQHHYAHALSLMAENNIKDEKILSVVWDGTGYGTDGNIWGGEFLITDYESFERVYHFKYFPLIGGEKAVKEPKRIALSIIFEMYGRNININKNIETLKHFSDSELEKYHHIWKKKINSPLTSSAGRLFDGVASILGIRQTITYEGQSGMIMENFYRSDVKDHYSFSINGGIIDFRPIFFDLIDDRSEVDVKISRFFNTLAQIVYKISEDFQDIKLGLTGGVFQNKPLTEKIINLIGEEKILLQKKVPPNDGGISLGQLVFKFE